MTKRIQTESTRLKVSVLAAVLLLLVACGGGGGSGSNSNETNLVESNPEFLAKAEAVSFSQLRLYPGHVSETGGLTELDVNNLASGDLITIEVEFSVTDTLTDYSVAVQLVPLSIFSQLDQGNTIGEIVNADTQQGEDFIELGGAYVDQIQSGVIHVVIHAKLPILEQDTVYKVLVTPSLAYLASGKDINNDDVNSVPVFFDDRELSISKLDAVSVKIVETADFIVDNEFTQLEIGGAIDANGFSVEPLFQTSIEVDITSFTESEEVVLSLSWVQPGGDSFPLGLLSSDVDGNPVISTEAHFSIERTDATSVTIPVVVFVTETAQLALLSEATAIQDIADQVVATGEFGLTLAYVENGINVDSGQSYNISIPLVKQEDRSVATAPTEVSGFTVLRAGITNSGCLSTSADDVTPDDRSLVASSCPDAPFDSSLWRYDLTTEQIINKNLATDGSAFCISAVDFQTVQTLDGLVVNTYGDFSIRKCEVLSSLFVNVGGDPQRFIFEGQKIRLKGMPVYLDVKFKDALGNPLLTPEVVSVHPSLDSFASVDDFFKDANGADVDSSGRLFHVGKSYDRGWGSVDTARVKLSYGGDTQLDYIPVLGATTEGHAALTASMFGKTVDLLAFNFTHKRYLSKQITLVSGNTKPVQIGNGAELKMDVLGRTAKTFGEIKTKTITESYALDTQVEAMLDVELSLEPAVNIDIGSNLHFDMHEEFLDFVFTVVVIPVHIKGGIDGLIDVTGKLTSTTEVIGIDALISEKLDLGGYLSADVLEVVTITGDIIVINQALDFNANGHFSLTADLPPALSFDASSSLTAELNLLKGKVTASVQYPSPCWCAPPWKMKTKDKVLYSSPYLFESKWTIYSAQENFPLIVF